MGLSRSTVVVIVSAVLLLTASGRTQQQQQQDPQQQRPIFRTSTDVVRVDVYPRRNGKVVEGLQKEDFKVTENGAAQTIDTFEYVSTGGFDAEPLDPRNAYEARKMAADPKNRVFVFYLDLYTIDMEGSERSREPLLNFFRFGLAPRDMVAVMTSKQHPEYLEFIRTTESLGAILSAGRIWGLADSHELEKDELELEACDPGMKGPPGPLVQRKRNNKVVHDLRELIIRLGLLKEERKNLIIIGGRWQGSGMRREPAAEAASNGQTRSTPSFQIGPPAIRGPGSFVPPPSAAERCARLRMAVGGPSTQQDIDELVTVARRANVAIYFINPAPQSLFNFSMARAIAEDTDGMNILTNDFALNLTKLMEHQTGYYMLGYRSTAGEVGRKEREIRVRTSAKGVELDIRRLYDPVPPDAAEMMRNPPPPVERTEVQKAMDSLARIDTDGPSTVVAEQRTGFVEITVELPARTAVEEPWRKGADVVVTLRDDNAVDIVSASGSIPAGERSARFAVVPPDTRIPRRVSVMITRDGRTMHDAVAISPASPFAAPLVFRAASPPRAPYLPAAIMQFDRTERIRVEWTMPATMTEPVVRLLNAASKELASDLVQTVVPAGPEPARLRADLRPVSLAIGDYALEASGEFDGVRVKHILAIRVVR